MSVDLEKALSAIQRGAEEQLEVLKSQKKQIEQGESSQESKVIGHIDKFEVEELEDEQKGEAEGAAVVAAEGDDIRGDETVGTGEAGEAPGEDKTNQTDKGKEVATEETEDQRKKPQVTKSIIKLREQRKQAKICEQEHCWKEPQKKEQVRLQLGK